jgi:hypothetical protein
VTRIGTVSPSLYGVPVSDVSAGVKTVKYPWQLPDGSFEYRTTTLEDPGFDVSDFTEVAHWAWDNGVTRDDIGNCTIYRNQKTNKIAFVRHGEKPQP